MALLLHLETSTKACSVAISKDGKLLALKEINTGEFSHAENLNIFIQDVLKETQLELKNLDAVVVSEGPGSYTGLRIGVSTAKGLCYALDKPMIAISSLKSLAQLADKKHDLICPVFDAMRMEVYTAVYTSQLQEIIPVKAKIIDENSFSDLLDKQSILFIGPAAKKCADVLKHPNAFFDFTTDVSALGMIRLAEEKFAKNQFEDVAYFEPFYLKDFVAGVKKTVV